MVLPGVSIPACPKGETPSRSLNQTENVLEYRLHKDQEELEIYQFETQLVSEVVNLGPFAAKTMQESKH